MLHSYIKATDTPKINNKDFMHVARLFMFVHFLLCMYKIKNYTSINTTLLNKNIQYMSKLRYPWFNSQLQYSVFTTLLTTKWNNSNILSNQRIKFKKFKKKIKLSKFQWKTIKRYANKNKKRAILHKIANGFFRSIKVIKIVKTINTRSLRKRVVIGYKTRKKFKALNYKLRYNNWIKNNKRKTKYTSLYSNLPNRSKINAKYSMVKFLVKLRSKKNAMLFFKRKLIGKQNHRVKFHKTSVHAHIHRNKKQTTKIKKIFAITFIYKNKPVSKKLTSKTNMFQNNSVQIVLVNKYIKNLKPEFYKLLNINIFKNSKKLSMYNDNLTKQQFKKQTYRMLFENSHDCVYDVNSTSINYVFNTPQLLLKSFSTTRNNVDAHYETNLFFENFNQNTSKQKAIHAITEAIKHTKTFNAYSNYMPLYFFKTTLKNEFSKKLTYTKTHNYYYNINVLATTKYKTFFIFFLLNFLENMVKKKIWIRLNTQDPINTVYKNYISFFLKKYSHLYKKFNKLIAVRELLEILWITFKNHDLIILLTFLKRKIESSHFKKHKKILSIFFDILRKNEQLFSVLNIKGFFFDIRGKVGVSGNAKKRHSSFSIGKITTTSQNLGSYFQQINVWTPTGQMGITCILQY